MWAAAGPARADHAYLVKKGISPHHFRQSADKVLVPMFDGDGHLRNLQRIGPDGSKRFLRGGRTSGLFFIFGEFTRRGETVYLGRSEQHTSELQSLMRISYAVFCLKKKKIHTTNNSTNMHLQYTII